MGDGHVLDGLAQRVSQHQRLAIVATVVCVDQRDGGLDDSAYINHASLALSSVEVDRSLLFDRGSRHHEVLHEERGLEQGPMP